MPLRESLQLAEHEPILSDRVPRPILAFEVRNERRGRLLQRHRRRYLRTRDIRRRSAAAGTIMSRTTRSPMPHDPVRILVAISATLCAGSTPM
jgi:hypothetical protein